MSEKKGVVFHKIDYDFGMAGSPFTTYTVYSDGSLKRSRNDNLTFVTADTDSCESRNVLAKELARLKLKYEPDTVKWPEPEVVDEWVPQYGSLHRRVLSNGRFQFMGTDGVWEDAEERIWGVALSDCAERIIQLKRGASD